MFQGAWTALVTPFEERKPEKINDICLKDLVRFQIERGKIDGLVACGTTGEAPALSEEEHAHVAQKVIEYSQGRVPVVVGTGSNNIDRTISATRAAAEMKADGALIVTPYYNRPGQEGLYRFYRKVADEVELPIILYNVPSRTGVNLLPETVLRLAKDVPNIKAIKEASGNLGQIEEILAGGFPVLSGDDALTYPILSLGGSGVISVVSNVAPGRVARMCKSFAEGDREAALEIHRSLAPLAKLLFIETSPVPCKAAMSLMGICPADVRLPLAPLSEESSKKVQEYMDLHGDILKD